MKKHFLSLVFLLPLLVLHQALSAQPVFTGTWEGRLNVGVELRIVFHISQENGRLQAKLDSPDQGAYGIPCDETRQNGDSIRIDIKAIGGHYRGLWKNETQIDGIFHQRTDFPLPLVKVDKPSERARPQTPQPPFPYNSEDLLYQNADKSLQYGATLTWPKGTGPFPAAILITGSGPQNRDEELFGHKLFAVIADHLTRNGLAVLRVDDRGVGKSTGDFNEATSADFADDVSAGVDYLLSRPEIDKKRIGLIGHSEGGMIAPMVATRRNDIDFIILLAGPGVKITEVLTEQTMAIMQSSGVSEKSTRYYGPFYRKLITEATRFTDTVKGKNIAARRFEKWARRTPAAVLQELGLESEGTRRQAGDLIVRTAWQKWFRYFLQFDPKPYLENLSCKVLVLNGEKDVQVLAEQNLPGIEAALKKSRATAVEIHSLPGLNHLFQTCSKCTVPEYMELEETFSPVALRHMSDWLGKHVISQKP